MLGRQETSTLPERPKARPDLRLQEIGEEGLLYDREGAMVHILNRTALFTWSQCDGSHTVSDIVTALADGFRGAEGVSVRQDVERILRMFMERGLLDTK